MFQWPPSVECGEVAVRRGEEKERRGGWVTRRGNGEGIEGGDGRHWESLLIIAVKVETKYYMKWDMRSQRKVLVLIYEGTYICYKRSVIDNYN